MQLLLAASLYAVLATTLTTMVVRAQAEGQQTPSVLAPETPPIVQELVETGINSTKNAFEYFFGEHPDRFEKVCKRVYDRLVDEQQEDKSKLVVATLNQKVEELKNNGELSSNFTLDFSVADANQDGYVTEQELCDNLRTVLSKSTLANFEGMQMEDTVVFKVKDFGCRVKRKFRQFFDSDSKAMQFPCPGDADVASEQQQDTTAVEESADNKNETQTLAKRSSYTLMKRGEKSTAYVIGTLYFLFAALNLVFGFTSLLMLPLAILFWLISALMFYLGVVQFKYAAQLP